MNKLKKFYKNNRIYCILMLISISCFILICASLLGYIISQSTKSEYGSRLEEIESYPVDDNINAIKTYLKSLEGVESSNVRLQGSIIYINVTVKDEATKEEIQNIANTALENISEENKEYYEIQYVFNRKSYDSYFGSKTANNDVISWSYSFDTEPNTEKD